MKKEKKSIVKYSVIGGVLFLFAVIFATHDRYDFAHAKEVLLHPVRMGAAIFPESKKLSRALANVGDLDAPGYVVELGAGTGNVTQYLVERYGAKNIIAVELSEDLCKVLQKRFPEVTVICADASKLQQSLVQKFNRIPHVKCIVSTLPIACLSLEQVENLNKNIVSVLRNKGIYAEYRFYNFKKPRKINNLNHMKNIYSSSHIILPVRVSIYTP